jgi:hypothetical protein
VTEGQEGGAERSREEQRGAERGVEGRKKGKQEVEGRRMTGGCRQLANWTGQAGWRVFFWDFVSIRLKIFLVKPRLSSDEDKSGFHSQILALPVDIAS